MVVSICLRDLIYEYFTGDTLINQERLRDVLHYDPDSGDFTWLNPTSFRVRIGDTAGYHHKTPDGKTYIQTAVDGDKHYAHRLAWFYMTGEFPVDQIDHINGDGTDNRWCNLRQVTHRENSKNQKLRSTNTSGVTGVYWDTKREKWCASITIKGKTVSLGRFDILSDAVDARSRAEIEYGFHENHGSVRSL